MDSRKFGYVRVSSKDQNENRQVESLKEIGIDDRDILVDKQSGKNFERERIRKRQREGIDSALANGVKFGRPVIQITDEFIQAYDIWQAGEITAVEAMKEADMKKTSFYKMVKELEALVKI